MIFFSYIPETYDLELNAALKREVPVVVEASS